MQSIIIRGPGLTTHPFAWPGISHLFFSLAKVFASWSKGAGNPYPQEAAEPEELLVYPIPAGNVWCASPCSFAKVNVCTTQSPGLNASDQMWQPCVITAPYRGISGWEEWLKCNYYRVYYGLKPHWSKKIPPRGNTGDWRRLKTSSGLDAHEQHELLHALQAMAPDVMVMGGPSLGQATKQDKCGKMWVDKWHKAQPTALWLVSCVISVHRHT